MSQIPVTAASNREANMNPSVTSHRTIEDEPVEAKLVTPAVSSDMEPKTSPFMKLAARTRLEIYCYLLVAVPSRAQSKENVSKGGILVMPADVVRDEKILYAKKQDRNRVYPFQPHLNPQILRTCKAIHREAAAVLYCVNIFCFWFGRLPSKELSQSERDTFKASCEKLYQDPAERWDDECDGSLRQFALFLLQIGQHNTKKLTKLKFATPVAFTRADCPKAGWILQAITQLLKAHVPNLSHLGIDRGFKRQDSLHIRLGPDEREQARREQEEAMHRAVADMVREITWLKRLSFVGFDDENSTYQKMAELQTLVKARR